MKSEQALLTDEVLLIYRLISSAVESLMLYRSPVLAAEHLDAARRACLRIGSSD
jgi:hypothetical protein